MLIFLFYASKNVLKMISNWLQNGAQNDDGDRLNADDEEVWDELIRQETQTNKQSTSFTDVSDQDMTATTPVRCHTNVNATTPGPSKVMDSAATGGNVTSTPSLSEQTKVTQVRHLEINSFD